MSEMSTVDGRTYQNWPNGQVLVADSQHIRLTLWIFPAGGANNQLFGSFSQAIQMCLRSCR